MAPRGLLLALMLLAACGGEPAPEAVPTPTAPTTPAGEPTEEPPEEPTAPPAECSDETITGSPEARLREVDNRFSPACLVVLGGQTLIIANRGSNAHNFSIEGTDVDIDTQPGDTTRTEPIGTIAEPGTHTFFCRFHRSLGMEGEITISQAG